MNISKSSLRIFNPSIPQVRGSIRPQFLRPFHHSFPAMAETHHFDVKRIFDFSNNVAVVTGGGGIQSSLKLSHYFYSMLTERKDRVLG